MNTQTTSTENKKTDWTHLRSQIKARFGKLTDESIDSAKENLDLLTLKLQSAYGYAREQAEKELSGFKATLLNTGPEPKQDEKPMIKVVAAEPVAEKPATPLASKVA